MIQIELPSDIEQRLQLELGDLHQVAKEAFLLRAFRTGKLSHHDLGQALGLDRFQTNAFLKRHDVFEGSLTLDDLEADRETLDRVLGPAR